MTTNHRHTLRCLEPRDGKLVCRLAAPSSYETAAAAAKAWGRRNGVRGERGGWLYGPTGEPISQGWASLAIRLEEEGRIKKYAPGDWRLG
jgi:hypothetical protein